MNVGRGRGDGDTGMHVWGCGMVDTCGCEIEDTWGCEIRDAGTRVI